MGYWVFILENHWEIYHLINIFCVYSRTVIFKMCLFLKCVFCVYCFRISEVFNLSFNSCLEKSKSSSSEFPTIKNSLFWPICSFLILPLLWTASRFCLSKCSFWSQRIKFVLPLTTHSLNLKQIIENLASWFGNKIICSIVKGHQV